MYNLVKETDLEIVSDVIERAFYTVPFYRFLYSERDGVSIDETADFDKYFKGKLKNYIVSSYKEGAIIIESGDFTSVSMLVTKGEEPETAEPEDDDIPLIYQTIDKEEKRIRKEAGLTGKVLDLALIAKDPEKKSSGSIGEVIKPFLEMANEKNLPLILGAGSEHAREVYEHYGFEVFGRFQLGMDKVNERGELDKNGGGIPVYYLVYQGRTQ